MESKVKVFVAGLVERHWLMIYEQRGGEWGETERMTTHGGRIVDHKEIEMGEVLPTHVQRVPKVFCAGEEHTERRTDAMRVQGVGEHA